MFFYQSVISIDILLCCFQCPVDMRHTLAANIVMMGGTAMLTGFQHRLHMELKELIQKPKYRDQLAIQSFKFHRAPSRENFTAWLGGMYGWLVCL